MLLYAVTIFLSAFLLFQVQPMIGKCILPWFGSSPAVWTTCMLFFQVLLLAGYGYAHALVSWLSRKQQGALHAVLLVLALFLLPITPRPPAEIHPENPTWQILGLLLLSVGVPYALLASTGPLLQGWFSVTHAGRSPYRLYALSNVGSLLALVSYPVACERFFRLQHQTWLWSGGFALFALLAAACAVRLWRHPATPENSPSPTPGEPSSVAAEKPRETTSLDILLWLLLPACGSVMLLAITNQMCQDVAVVPFLWVLPLGLYLVTFIVAFESERWYVRGVFVPYLFVAAALLVWALFWGVKAPLWFQVLVYASGVFFFCLPCHGELVRRKPGPRQLTLFYLLISLGGALGGIFVALVAPQVFGGYWELHLGIVATCVTVTVAVAQQQWSTRKSREQRWTWGDSFEPAADANPELARELGLTPNASPSPLPPPGRLPPPWWLSTWTSLAALGIAGLVVALVWQVIDARNQAIQVERDFYGVLSVEERDLRPLVNSAGQRTGEFDRTWHRLSLVHGRIMHGYQLQTGEKRSWPTSYYGRNSGIGVAIEKHPQRGQPDRPFKIGVVGLGTGTIAAYAQPGNVVCFYDINPHLVEFSDRHFTYVADARKRGAQVDVFLGDARLVLDRQLQAGAGQEFDVLAIDAFSGDAIPIHLLTQECLDIYLAHLRPTGVLAIHVSNRYLDLKPVVRKLAAERHCEALWIDARENEDFAWGACDWVLVTKNDEFIRRAKHEPEYAPWTAKDHAPVLWTDDFSSVYQILKLK